MPRSGEGAFYTQTMGLILPQPVAKLQWEGDSFSFNTLLRVMGPGAGFYAVTGTIDKDGYVHGKLQRLGNAASIQPLPSYQFDGVHKK